MEPINMKIVLKSEPLESADRINCPPEYSTRPCLWFREFPKRVAVYKAYKLHCWRSAKKQLGSGLWLRHKI